MTVWYIDPESGTDSNSSAGNGDSFATRRKKFSNLTAASLVAGDEVRFKASPDATSLGINGTWTKGPIGANVSITSSTNATPIVVTATSHGLTTGDTVLIDNHSTNTNANGVWTVNVLTSSTFQLLNADGSNSTGNGTGGATGTISNITSAVVTLASEITKNIACYGNRNVSSTWTASANVTFSKITSTYREGGEAIQLAIASGFTTGKAAYFTLSSTDFSGYQQISFYVRQSSGTVSSDGDIQIKLCSDTTGATAVDTFNVPSTISTNNYIAYTVDKGSALGSAIQSVAIYVTVDRGAQTFQFDNIIACKASSSADSLSLTSWIGKTAGNYYSVQSINSTRVVINSSGSDAPISGSMQRGYYGTTETVTTYKREPFHTTPVSSTTTVVDQINNSGTSGSPITVSGGWNTTDMTTQTGKTWISGVNSRGYGMYINGKSYITGFTNMSFVEYSYGMYLNNSSDLDITMDSINSCSSYGLFGVSTQNCSLSIDYIENNNVGISPPSNCTITSLSINNNDTNGIELKVYNDHYITDCSNNGNNGVIGDANDYYNFCNIDSCKDNGDNGVYINGSFKTFINNCTMSGNTYDARVLNDVNVYLNNCTLGNGLYPVSNSYRGRDGFFCQKYNGTAGDHRQYLSNGVIKTNTSTVYNSNDYSWEMSPTTTTYCFERNPLTLVLGQIEVSNGTVISCFFRRSNTGVSAKLVCKAGQLSGLTADITDAMTASADTWEQLSITLTPSETGIVEIYAEVYGGTTYSVFVDMDLTVA